MPPRFSSRRLRAIVRTTLARLPEDAPPEQVIAAVHRELRIAYPGEISLDLRWSTVSAAFGTQLAAPVAVFPTEYLVFTGTAVPTGGETGRFLANLEDIILSGEIDMVDSHRQRPTTYGAGESVHQGDRRGGVFAVREHVWMLEHMNGVLPAMFILPSLAMIFSTWNMRSYVGMTLDALRLLFGWGTDDSGPHPWKNWLGNVRALPRSIRRVNNEWEIKEIVDEVATHNQSSGGPPVGIRCFGTRHSWSALAPSAGVMLDMTVMDSVLDIDPSTRCITVEPGMMLGQLLELAWEEGWRIRSVTALKKITVGGMLAVGAHGNDTSAATFSDDVVAIRFVDGTGQVQVVDESDMDALRAARINLGALGVVVALTVRCFDSGLFLYQTDTLCHADVATQEQIDAIVAANQLVEIYWFPFIDRVQVLRWNPVDEDDLPAFVRRYDWRDRLRNWLMQNIGQYLVGTPVAFIVDRIMPSLGWILVWLSSRMFSTEETLQTPLDAGHYLYAYHKVRDSGWAVPAETTADALKVYAEMIQAYKRDGHYPVNICVHMRFIRAGTSTLGFGGAASGGNADALLCQIEAAMTAHADRAVPYLRHIERAFLLPHFKGRPHWAKEWWVDVHPFALGGSASWKTFRSFRAEFDPDGLFANKLIHRIDRHTERVEELLGGQNPQDLDDVRRDIIAADDTVLEVLRTVFGDRAPAAGLEAEDEQEA